MTSLVANAQGKQSRGLWQRIDYDGEPWVKNTSLPYKTTKGLYNRHIALWASHGRYYDQKKGRWKWQRPNLFCTTEDLFTQTIVVPYLIPMLENAGAVVFTPRERDWQTNEIIIDNDTPRQGTAYVEANARGEWHPTPTPGFAFHQGSYRDNENPFLAGTARQSKATRSKKRYNLISYQPNFPEEGRYAVYVSYQTVKKSVDDASYTVWHKGEKTTFKVNQQMGGGTWVYLGTFDFDKGSSEYNRVELTSQSAHRGVVTADAVRFGGGMGNIERGGTTSGMPRCLEGARYYAQWAGMPYDIYSTKKGTDDYSDDINVRSLMTNTLGGGSVYMPSREGLGVPLELSLAVHSDAGYRTDDTSLIGSLAVCTTRFNDGRLNAGISRLASRDFAQTLLDNLSTDLAAKGITWPIRELRDQNYSETRLPEVPSAIIETLSHQNFNDMRLGLDPDFRFTMARSFYKSILKFVTRQHNDDYQVTPLTPTDFAVDIDANNGVATLSWSPVNDPLEPTARPTGYVVYTATGSADFDNGTVVGNNTSTAIHLEPGVLYSFRVAAINKGGCSFPSEVLSAVYNPYARHKIMIVNAFDRLSSPGIVNRPLGKGFDIDADAGLTYGKTIGWCGRQTVFNTKAAGGEGPGALGYSTGELEGRIVAGNDYNYVRTHAAAIQSTGNYTIVSCSRQALENGKASLSGIHLADLLFGAQRKTADGRYAVFTPRLMKIVADFANSGGSLLVSGSSVASDQTTDAERAFLRNIIKCDFGGSYDGASPTVKGMSTEFDFYHSLNATHYAVTSPDILAPVSPAFATLAYNDGQPAATAYSGDDYRVLALSIPIECIIDGHQRNALMRGFVDFLLK